MLTRRPRSPANGVTLADVNIYHTDLFFMVCRDHVVKTVQLFSISGPCLRLLSFSVSCSSGDTGKDKLAQAYILWLQQTKGKNTMLVTILNSKSPTYSHWSNFCITAQSSFNYSRPCCRICRWPGMGRMWRLHGPRGRGPVFQERAQADYTRLWLEYSSRRGGNRSRTLNIMVMKMIKFEEEAEGEWTREQEGITEEGLQFSSNFPFGCLPFSTHRWALQQLTMNPLRYSIWHDVYLTSRRSGKPSMDAVQ